MREGMSIVGFCNYGIPEMNNVKMKNPNNFIIPQSHNPTFPQSHIHEGTEQ